MRAWLCSQALASLLSATRMGFDRSASPVARRQMEIRIGSVQVRAPLQMLGVLSTGRTYVQVRCFIYVPQSHTEREKKRSGEAIILTRSGVSRRQVVPAATFAPDIFEYVYLARPDSVLDGISVYRSRMAMGNALAKEVQRVLTEKNITVDVVIPVPDTSRVAALNLAQALGLPYREGFVKNRYIGRTFIMPEQQMRYVSVHLTLLKYAFSCLGKRRKKNVRRKLNAMALEFAGKNVLIVDGKSRVT